MAIYAVKIFKAKLKKYRPHNTYACYGALLKTLISEQPLLRRLRLHLTLCRIQHILYKYSIPLGGICHHHVCHRAHELAVLDNRAARQ